MSDNAVPITEIPVGIALAYQEEQWGDPPKIAIEEGKVVFPAFVRRDGDGYKWIPVPVTYNGQDLDDYEKLKKQCYAELRRYFYGTSEQQLELQYKGKLNAHINAVRKAFPNPYYGDRRTVFTRYEVLKAFMQIPELYESVVAAYQNNIDVQLFWNSVPDIDIENQDLIRIRGQLGITDELVEQLVAIIENGVSVAE